jgi:hypothetical protein
MSLGELRTMNLSAMSPEGAFNWLMITIGLLVVLTIGLFYYAGFF